MIKRSMRQGAIGTFLKYDYGSKIPNRAKVNIALKKVL